jgi:hypothetical protein
MKQLSKEPGSQPIGLKKTSEFAWSTRGPMIFVRRIYVLTYSIMYYVSGLVPDDPSWQWVDGCNY